ncbi:MAG: MFS transporter [Patescibacteria group bacterium]|nr:MFS transporter [Patescibacteria group bacterium]
MRPHIAEKLGKSDIKDVKLSVIFKNLGQGLYNIFEPIIFYNILDHRFELVLLYYGIQSFYYAALAHIGARVMGKIGIKKNLIWGTLFLIFYCLTILYFSNLDITLATNPGLTILAFCTLATIASAYQSLYWPAFHTDLSLFMRRKESGKNIGTFYLIGQMTSVIGPILGALILLNLSLTHLITLEVLLLLISTLPLIRGPDEHPHSSLSFGGFVKFLFSKKRFKYYLPFYAEGINGYIAGVFWGLFVYTILQNILDLGLIASGVSLFTGLFVFGLGYFIDKRKHLKDKILRIGVTTSSIGWIIKGLPTSGLFFFVADNIQKFGDIVARIPFEKVMYNRFKSIKSLADEYVVIREMAYHIGGGIIMIILAVIIWQFNLMYSAFIVAAISSLVYLLMR